MNARLIDTDVTPIRDASIQKEATIVSVNRDTDQEDQVNLVWVIID
jgi:hypothetical protein